MLFFRLRAQHNSLLGVLIAPTLILWSEPKHIHMYIKIKCHDDADSCSITIISNPTVPLTNSK